MPDLRFDAARVGKFARVMPDQLVCKWESKHRQAGAFTAILDKPVGGTLAIMAFDAESDSLIGIGLVPDTVDLNQSLWNQPSWCIRQSSTGASGGGPGMDEMFLDEKVIGHTGMWFGVARKSLLLVWRQGEADRCTAALYVDFKKLGNGGGFVVPAGYTHFAICGRQGVKVQLRPELAAEAEGELARGEESFNVWLDSKRKSSGGCCLIA